MPKKSNIIEFKQKVKNLTNNEYEVIGDYKNHMTKIQLKHKTCNFEYSVTPNKFLDLGRRCPKCFGNIKKTLSEVANEISNLTKNEYSLLSTDYKDTNFPIEIKHNICGNSFKMRRTDFVKPNGNRCPYCAGLKKKTLDIVKNEIKNITNNEFEIISDSYKNNKTKLKIIHHSCNKEFKNSYNLFLKYKSCPYCSIKESKGEEKIKNFLILHKIQFKPQFRLSSFSKKYSFDFAVFNEIGLKILIEYDGEMHYHPIFGESELKKQQKNDELKNVYCKENNIKLLRIPYWDFEKIENILCSTTIESTSKDGSK